MLAIYLKIAARNLLANKVVTAINIIGLSIAVGCSIVVFLFLKNQLTMDNFHEHGERIFMLEHVLNNEGQPETWGTSPIPLGPALAEKFPQVERVVRLETQPAKVYLDERVFEDRVCFADPDFFDMFSFTLQAGNPAALHEPDAVILSAAVAAKYFKNEAALGKTIAVVFDNQVRKVFTVKGIATPFPENTSLRFELLTGFGTLAAIGTEGLSDWRTHIQSTFVQVQHPEDIAVLSANMVPFAAQHNAANPELPIQSFIFDNLLHPNARAYEVFRRPVEAAHPLLVGMFIAIALLMMALSCFNYINIALGFVGKRLKEIGIRKTIGGKKSQLIGQFMAENLLLCFLALLAGLALTQLVLVPFMNGIMVEQISLSFAGNYSLWLFLLALLAFTGAASGAYPAFYISSFQPVSIFKGKQQFGAKTGLTRVLLALQFVLAFSTVIVGVAVSSAGWYWKDLSWGYQPDQTLLLRLDRADQFSFLKNEAERNPQVIGVAGAAEHVGESRTKETIYSGSDKLEVIRYGVGAGYFETMGLRLKTGRFFDAQHPVEDAGAALVNESFVKNRHWDKPIGQEFRSQGQMFKVVGVVEDFKMYGSGANRPAVFQLAPAETFGYLAIRHQVGAGTSVQEFMQSNWERLYPATPFSYFHQSAVFEGFYRSYGNLAAIFNYIAGLALLIACLGLFGLAAQNFSSRLKEVSIRKVLGASTWSILLLANRRFLYLLVLASGVATVCCYLGIQVLIASAAEFTGDLRLGVMPYLLANLLVFLTAAIAVGGQSWKLVRLAPVRALQEE
ncbi:MAG: ABC transporter permease [Saprospiraceae bacterium]|nr:ABC transporter permease [Saprospiraceae bacterium]